MASHSHVHQSIRRGAYFPQDNAVCHQAQELGNTSHPLRPKKTRPNSASQAARRLGRLTSQYTQCLQTSADTIINSSTELDQLYSCKNPLMADKWHKLHNATLRNSYSHSFSTPCARSQKISTVMTRVDSVAINTATNATPGSPASAWAMLIPVTATARHATKATSDCA